MSVDVAQETIDTPEQGQVEDTQVDPVQVEDTPPEGQVENLEPGQEVSGWEADKRFKEHWSEDPNKMYDSLKHLEKRQSEFQDQSENFTKLQDYQKNVQDILNHNVLGPQINKVIQDFENQQLKTQYGENLSEDQLDHIRQQSQRLEELESKVNSQEEQKNIDAFKAQAETSLTEIDALAKKNGIEYKREEFLNYCTQNEVPVALMKAVFLEHANEKMLERAMNNGEQNAFNNIKSNNAGNLGASQDKANNKEKSWDEALNGVLGI